MTSFAEFRNLAITRLTDAGVATPEVDADLLVGHVLDMSRGEVQAKAIAGAELRPDQVDELTGLLDRRVAREPLQHITGRAYFRSLELAVGPGVFVPRPETEQVAQYAVDALRAIPAEHPIAVDLGTGSGAIAFALATEVSNSLVYAVEVSPDAFRWTEINRDLTRATNAAVVLGDLADAFTELDGTADVVVSNPPYIPTNAVPRDREVQLHDPPTALYGGADGLDVVRQVSRTGLRLLHPGGTLVLEHGELQGASIADLLRADGWTAVATHRDLLGRDRATTALKSP
ncbi:MAG TPA: peptide chain release factor N(5)-glutamine methyltransferase [Galbitalea sp.]|jgi:release factor glutamine methyltransferase|nr:peptide chain release factor N(5)-glutamine methyltransferase [Galbitalea sp.]